MIDPITISLAWKLAQFVPDIARWITGSDKAGDAAAKVIEVAEVVTGQKGEAAVTALQADPMLVMQFRQAVMNQEIEFDRMYLADRQSARLRDVELAKAGRVGNKRADIMVALAAGGTVLGLVALMILGYMKAKHPEALNEGVFTALLVQLTTITSIFGLCMRDAFQFEFGSSRGSKDKGDQQADVMAAIATTIKGSKS